MFEVNVVVSEGYCGSLPLPLVLWEDMEEQLGERRKGDEATGNEKWRVGGRGTKKEVVDVV